MLSYKTTLLESIDMFGEYQHLYKDISKCTKIQIDQKGIQKCAIGIHFKSAGWE